jgi:hypothetical protein
MVDCHYVATPIEEGAQLSSNMELELAKAIEYQTLVKSLIYFTIDI